MQDLLSAICEGYHDYDGDDVIVLRVLHNCNNALNTLRSKVKSSDTSLIRSNIIDTIKTKETEAETETLKLLQQVEATTYVPRQLQRMDCY